MTKKIRQINVLKEYAYTLIMGIVAYALFSTILDEIFFKIDYGDAPGNLLLSVMHYLVYGMTMGFFGWIIISSLYATFYVKFKIVTSKRIWRMTYAIVFGILFGFLLKDSEGSYYIGDMRPQRNMILYTLTSIIVEALRIIFLNKQVDENTA